jgi:hypothetical protein
METQNKESKKQRNKALRVKFKAKFHVEQIFSYAYSLKIIVIVLFIYRIYLLFLLLRMLAGIDSINVKSVRYKVKVLRYYHVRNC